MREREVYTGGVRRGAVSKGLGRETGGDNGDSEGVRGQCDNCWIAGAIEGITGGDNGDSGEGVRGQCDNCWIGGAIEGITGGVITLLILPAVS